MLLLEYMAVLPMQLSATATPCDFTQYSNDLLLSGNNFYPQVQTARRTVQSRTVRQRSRYWTNANKVSSTFSHNGSKGNRLYLNLIKWVWNKSSNDFDLTPIAWRCVVLVHFYTQVEAENLFTFRKLSVDEVSSKRFKQWMHPKPQALMVYQLKFLRLLLVLD